MANLTESASWETGIYQIETTDPVVGGASGTANTQGKQLANRTLWLRAQMEDIQADLQAQIDAIETTWVNRLVPCGSILPHGGSALPAGFLLCDGSLISRASYANLFAVIGTTYGAGNGSTTFALPDLRGEFLRGLDQGRGVDSGRGLGTSQGQAIQTHNHYLPTSTGSAGSDIGISDTAFLTDRVVNKEPRDGYFSVTYPRSSYVDGSTIGDTGTFAAETRPRNVAVNFIIKV